MKDKIAAGLERTFAKHGFAETDIETLRAGADVSLRTLYKYFPTREERMLAALEHRHRRYLVCSGDDAWAGLRRPFQSSRDTRFPDPA